MPKKLNHEKKVVELMVRLYCRKREGNDSLCADCEALLAYAHARLDRCRFGEQKPSCQRCPIHCYRPEMRERIRQVMRWAGPRMLLYHPLIALRHLWAEKWQKPTLSPSDTPL
ncbi:MAG: nitrous oxide-stimulated promoter family protein [Bacteroidaceae bacterium]|nr:nitrous oxide-stimulated promoter family protein [Bacteroidaceae bacterium]